MKIIKVYAYAYTFLGGKMRKVLEFIGICFLLIITFYLTDKTVKLANKKDPLMIKIKENEKHLNKNCIEGYKTKDGVILSTPGKEVDIYESYSNMENKIYDESKIVYKEIKCKVSMENSKDDIIISASKINKELAIFIIIDDINNFKKIKNKINNNYSLLINGKTLKDNIDYIEKLSKEGYVINYINDNKDDFILFDQYKNKINTSNICVTYLDDDMSYCKEKGYTRIKTKYYYTSNIYNNVLSNLENGSFYILRSNEKTLEEIGALSKYLKAKNIDIMGISVLLK